MPAGNDELGERFVFNPDLSESENLEMLPDDLIDKQLGFQPVHLQTGFDGSGFTGTERSRNEWTIWVLTALLCFALGETLWAWFAGARGDGPIFCTDATSRKIAYRCLIRCRFRIRRS